jgi:putative endonuclease
MNERTTLGIYGEQLVADYLQNQKFAVVAKNFRKRDGEVDLIARRGSLTVFVEVKTRSSQRIDPAEVITISKQRKIARAAAFFMTQETVHLDREYDCRFDVAIVSFETDKPSIMYIADAFQVEEYA